MLATIEPPTRLLTRGDACLIEARVCRPRTKGAGEGDAILVSQVRGGRRIEECLPAVMMD